MFLILRIIFNALVDHFSIAGKDPRTRDLLLVGSYPLILTIIGMYILFVLKIGPRFMANRRPYNVKTLVQIYNVLQIIMNAYIFYGTIKYYLWSPEFQWACVKYDPDYNSFRPFRTYAFLYYLNKIFDFTDTIFFVLRKKFNQITFLHVYHHAIMAWAMFIYLNLQFGSEFSTVGHINSLVHVIMYIYYFLAASDININLDSLKPFVTLIQIAQFSYFTIKFFIALIYVSSCKLSLFWLTALIIQNFIMTAMFSHFYYKTYIANDKRKVKN